MTLGDFFVPLVRDEGHLWPHLLTMRIAKLKQFGTNGG